MNIKVSILSILLFVSGCSGVRVEHHTKQESIYGNWYLKESKTLNSNTKIKITKKEQFFKNGQLISTKWFNFVDNSGKNLGEFYITKLFTWQNSNKRIEVKFKRCSTAVTKKLQVGEEYYAPLSNSCNSQKSTNRITTKDYKIIKNRLILGGKVYSREN